MASETDGSEAIASETDGSDPKGSETSPSEPRLPKARQSLARDCQRTAKGLPKDCQELHKASSILAKVARRILSGGKSVQDWSEWF